MVGKKAKDPKDMKTQRIIIRLSESDYQAIKQIAQDKGVHVSDLVRSMIERERWTLQSGILK